MRNWIFFSIRVFFHGHWQLTGQQGKGGEHFLLHSTTPTRPRTFGLSFAILHVRWLPHIFNRTACIYQTATWWNLPAYRTTIWSIDVMLMVVCLLVEIEFRFCYSYLTWETGGLEFALTIILVLQANRLTNSAFSRNQVTFFQFSRKGKKDLPQRLPLVTRL